MNNSGFNYDHEELRIIPIEKRLKTFQICKYPHMLRRSEFKYTHSIVMHIDRYNKMTHICMGFYKSYDSANKANLDFIKLNIKNKHISFSIEEVKTV